MKCTKKGNLNITKSDKDVEKNSMRKFLNQKNILTCKKF